MTAIALKFADDEQAGPETRRCGKRANLHGPGI